MDWFSKNVFTQRMLEKYQQRKGLKSVLEFRLMKQYINNARDANKESVISKRLKEFMEDDSLTLDHLIIPSADVSASARKLWKSITKIETAIHDLNVQEFYGEEELWLSLERLLQLIRAKLRAAGRRLKE
jgi:hypothetical protein